MKTAKRPHSFQAVPQLHGMGCAVACVAARLGSRYSRALQLFSEPTHAWKQGYFCEDIVAAMAKAGFPYSFSQFEKKTHADLLGREGTIVFIQPNEQYLFGHYLVRSKKGWMNPWINCPEMIPVKAGFQKQLPGEPSYIVYEKTE